MTKNDPESHQRAVASSIYSCHLSPNVFANLMSSIGEKCFHEGRKMSIIDVTRCKSKTWGLLVGLSENIWETFTVTFKVHPFTLWPLPELGHKTFHPGSTGLWAVLWPRWNAVSWNTIFYRLPSPHSEYRRTRSSNSCLNKQLGLVHAQLNPWLTNDYQVP